MKKAQNEKQMHVTKFVKNDTEVETKECRGGGQKANCELPMEL